MVTISDSHSSLFSFPNFMVLNKEEEIKVVPDNLMDSRGVTLLPDILNHLYVVGQVQSRLQKIGYSLKKGLCDPQKLIVQCIFELSTW